MFLWLSLSIMRSTLMQLEHFISDLMRVGHHFKSKLDGSIIRFFQKITASAQFHALTESK